ncbi:hypothetical protein PoB_006221700 [Plakobranchus ocellatus]|uniref:Uncharacterized protein n=1 Tax=Plakobranchus ocellatus TaxID=259542 RepID=A0AAV4CUX1_9GAST|nr:hypothetical protein PoB_006221700 [Plakobranchus ocellatus]
MQYPCKKSGFKASKGGWCQNMCSQPHVTLFESLVLQQSTHRPDNTFIPEPKAHGLLVAGTGISICGVYGDRLLELDLPWAGLIGNIFIPDIHRPLPHPVSIVLSPTYHHPLCSLLSQAHVD